MDFLMADITSEELNQYVQKVRDGHGLLNGDVTSKGVNEYAQKVHVHFN